MIIALDTLVQHTNGIENRLCHRGITKRISLLGPPRAIAIPFELDTLLAAILYEQSSICKTKLEVFLVYLENLAHGEYTQWREW